MTSSYWRGSRVAGVLLSMALGACSSHSAVPFAHQQENPDEVTVLGNDVYWATFGGPTYLRGCNVSGCAASPQNLASGSWLIDRFAVDQNSLYFAFEGDDDSSATSGAASIGKCPRSGCTGVPATIVGPSEITSADYGSSFVSALAVDAENVYWATAHGVRECPLVGCGASGAVTLGDIDVLAGPVLSPSAIAVDAARVYWSDPYARTVVACAIGGCGGAPAVLATDQEVDDLVLDGKQLSWIAAGTATSASAGTVRTCDVTSCAATLRTLATAEYVPVAIAAQNGVVFWAEEGKSSDGSIWRCSSDGSDAPSTIGASPAPGYLAVGDGRVFWSDAHDGAVYSAPMSR